MNLNLSRVYTLKSFNEEKKKYLLTSWAEEANDSLPIPW